MTRAQGQRFVDKIDKSRGSRLCDQVAAALLGRLRQMQLCTIVHAAALWQSGP